jgi:hypothetical protein
MTLATSFRDPHQIPLQPAIREEAEAGVEENSDDEWAARAALGIGARQPAGRGGVAEGGSCADVEGVEDDEGVSDAVLVAEPVGVPVGDAEPVPLAVPLGESERLGVMDALAPRESDPVGDGDDDAAADSLAEGVPVEVPVGVDVRLAVPVGVALIDAETESEPD